MKTRNIGKSIALLALLTSCSTEELTTNATPTPGQQVTITASLGSSTDTDKPGTRMSYDENTDTEVGGLLTKWTEGDAFNIMLYNSIVGVEGEPQLFTLDAASIGKTEGTFTGTAPDAGSGYVIYYPANKIKNRDEFRAFSYTTPMQVQKGNGNRDHLTAYHSIKLTTEADYTKIDFSEGYQSSCMKFILTLPDGDDIVPKTITLASVGVTKCFYATNSNGVDAGDIASLSMELSGITLTGTGRTITAYMMMSYRDVYLSPEGITVTVDAEDGSSYSQHIETPLINGNALLSLEGGKMHTIIAKNMKKVEPSNARPGGFAIRRI